jgi:preprotein translocase subunit SecA
MRLFRSERIASLMDKLGAQEGEVLTHPLVTRSIEQAQKRVEMQNFQTRKRLLDFDDVMNQQREVIYSLRSFALEGGEELKGEARRMLQNAVTRRIETHIELFDSPEDWDFGVLRQDLLMHYLMSVPQLEEGADHPRDEEELKRVARETADHALDAKLAALDTVKDENGAGYSHRLLSLVALNVIDEKWKDHLYDLDQLRNTIYYRAWGQKDPLVEYKGEAYTMFQGLMADIANAFAERFLRVQLVFEQPAAPQPPQREAPRTTRRFNALGMLEDVPAESPDGNGAPEDRVVEVGPDEPPKRKQVARAEPTIVGAGRSMQRSGEAVPVQDWSTVGRNDPCPCGSGKKFKKCHGANG